MDYEYVEDVAGELEVDGDGLQQVIDQLGIKTLHMAVPPYGVELSTAVSHQDADRLRSYFAAQTGKASRRSSSGVCAGGSTCRPVSTG